MPAPPSVVCIIISSQTPAGLVQWDQHLLFWLFRQTRFSFFHLLHVDIPVQEHFTMTWPRWLFHCADGDARSRCGSPCCCYFLLFSSMRLCPDTTITQQESTESDPGGGSLLNSLTRGGEPVQWVTHSAQRGHTGPRRIGGCAVIRDPVVESPSSGRSQSSVVLPLRVAYR